jgi:hypothetical protein
MKRLSLFLSLSLLLSLPFLPGCGSMGGVANKTEVFVAIGGTQRQSGDTVTFPSTEGLTSSELAVVVGNNGYSDLTVTSIELLAGGNQYISIDPAFGANAFPRSVKTGDQKGGSAIKFDVRYQPGAAYDGKDSILKIVTNDPDLPKGVFQVTLSPIRKAPVIVVTPNNYTFVGATASQPDWAEFTISNAGTEVLEIYGVSLESPTDEFTIPVPVNQGTLIDPDGTGGGNPPVTFKLRYAPVDAGDENNIVIESNDPVSPKMLVHVRGETQVGELKVSYQDELGGCVDFTAQSNPGDSCTKVIKLRNDGEGTVRLSAPKVLPVESAGAYAIHWYPGGGSQAAACGAYTPASGVAEITESLYGLATGKTIDVVVTYTAPGAKGANGTLSIDYTSPYPGQAQIPLCGGAAKGELATAPSEGETLYFFAAKGSKTQKTLVLMNKGNGTLLIHSVKVSKTYEPDPDAFTVVTAVNELQLDALALFPVTVEFGTDYDATIVNASLDVSYRDPITDADLLVSIPLKGSKDFEDVTLPTANPGTSADYAGLKAGDTLMLDGSKSTGGTYAIDANGYFWFVVSKPPASQVFLNKFGAESKVNVIVDQAGEYEFRLVVFSMSSDGAFYFSDEGSVKVTVGS